MASPAGAAAAAFVRSAEDARAAELSRSSGGDSRRGAPVRRNGSGERPHTAASEAWASALLHQTDASRAGGSAHGAAQLSGASEAGYAHPPAAMQSSGREAPRLGAAPPGPPVQLASAPPTPGPHSSLAGAPVSAAWVPDGWGRDGGGGSAAVDPPGTSARSAAAQRGFVTAAGHIARMVRALRCEAASRAC